jgi:predicted amidohydrolase
MKEMTKFGVSAVQTAPPDAATPEELNKNVEMNLTMIRQAVEGAAVFGPPVKLVVLPEDTINGFPFPTGMEYVNAGVAVEVGGPITDKYVAISKELDIVLCTGAFVEYDPKYPKHVFNTILLITPEDGIVLKYRKVNPWLATELYTSPCQIKGYDEELFPVADTKLGKIGCINCYDIIFPETARELASKGMEILLRPTAYMDPWVQSGELDWFRTTSKARALENVCYGINCNIGSSLEDMPPFCWPGGSNIVDFEGRILEEVTTGGNRILYGHFDMDSLRAWRASIRSHMGIAHVRSDAYTYLNKPWFPDQTHTKDQEVTLDDMLKLTEEARHRIGWDKWDPATGHAK